MSPRGLPTVDPALEAAGEVDYKALYEEEAKKRRSLEGRVGSLMQEIKRAGDARVDLASRLFEALIVKAGVVPQGDDLAALVDSVVDAADELLDTLKHGDEEETAR